MISANRQTLLKLKKRLKSTQRGHKLLKDKRDSLMQTFLALIKETIALRKEIDEKYAITSKSFKVAKSQLDENYFDLLSQTPTTEIEVHKHIKNVMSVKVPELTYYVHGDAMGFSFNETNTHFDTTINHLSGLMEKIVKLIEKEFALRKIADELIVTRRRVSALENKVIPQIENDIKYVKNKLEEIDIDTKSKLLRVKAMQEEG